MKAKCLFLALTFIAASAGQAQAADMSGSWVISSAIAPPTSCTFVQTGNFFVGSCTGHYMDGLAFGVMNGHVMRWTWQARHIIDLSLSTLGFLGKLDSDNKIDGTIMFGPNVGQFTAASFKPSLPLADENEQLANNPAFRTCAEFVEGYKGDPKLEDNWLRWARGFYDGSNKVLKEHTQTIRDTSSVTPDDEKSRIQSYCNANPLRSYVAAVVEIYNSMPVIAARN
jgi:hypothetical protein